MKRVRRNATNFTTSVRSERVKEQYKSLVSLCANSIKQIARPCLKLRRHKKEQKEQSVVVLILLSFWQSVALRVAAIREHIRTLHIAHEQTMFWLHSGNPYAP